MGSLVVKLDDVSEVRPIAPPPVKPELAATKLGYVKVRLTYLTSEPQHLRSLLLYHTCGIQPPYIEEVSILLPQSKVFPLLEVFIAPFEYLQQSGVVSKTAELQDFVILDEDVFTLSYIF